MGSVAPEDDQLPLMLSCWCSIDLLMIFFFFTIIYRPGWTFWFGINLFLFLHKIKTRLKHYSKSKLLYLFFDFWSDFWYPRKVIVCFLPVLILLLLLLLPLFFSKLLIIFCNVFRSYLFSQILSVKYSIYPLKYFSEQILVALARNHLNMLVTVPQGIQE